LGRARARIERNEVKADKDVDLIKALTIKQLWAYVILRLGKDVENRSWQTHYRGPLLIHAAAPPERNPREILAEYMKRPPSEQSLGDLPVGCIVGVVHCIRDSTSRWASEGPWHWLLRSARAIEPVDCMGRLGLWTPSATIVKKLPKQVGEAGKGSV